jgi:hypothetical protein
MNVLTRISQRYLLVVRSRSFDCSAACIKVIFMSSSSDSSGPSSVGGDENDLLKLAIRIRKKLSTPATEPMAVADHQKGTAAMLQLRDLILASNEPIAGEIKMALTCAGIAIQRRVAISDALLPVELEQFLVTMALLFVLVVLCNEDTPCPSGAGFSDDGMDCEDDQQVSESNESIAIATWEMSSLISELTAADSVETDSWSEVLKGPGNLCQMCLKKAARRSHEMTLSELSNMGALFFRTSARALVTSLFDSVGHPSDNGSAFLTLDSVGFMAQANNNLDERLISITECAESEAGQAVLRDLILSFKLPRVVVGVRRTCLLSRQSNKEATEKYTQLLGEAHDAAMRGAKWSFEIDSDPVHKMCAILAGLAVMMCKHSQSIRKDDMYYGQVDLPFLETTCTSPLSMRLALLEHSHEWVVYSLDARCQPCVVLRQRGHSGLLQAAVLFSSKLTRA